VKDVLLKGDGAGLSVLRELRPLLASHADWTPAALEGAIRTFGESKGLGLGKVAQPLRVAVTGSMVSPPLFDTLVILGRDRALARLDRALTTAFAPN
jgi:glutamyl-tRNA synthetase